MRFERFSTCFIFHRFALMFNLLELGPCPLMDYISVSALALLTLLIPLALEYIHVD